MARFFVDRPVFATVLSLVIVLIGGVALMQLPIAQYPEVAPPTIQIIAAYPGANSQIVAETVASPIEQEINGVERMLYMASRCTNDGQMTLDVTFELGTNIDQAQVLVQNRVAIAEAKLPEEVRRQGIVTKKKSPSILLAVNLISSEARYDQLYLSNFATIEVKDSLMRIPGVGDVGMLGARDYAMRVWLDPEKLAVRNLTAIDVLQALREQNVQVAAGRIGQAPAADGQDFQFAINTKGRLLDASQFDDIVLKTDKGGQLVRLSDVARTELGARNYDVSSSLDGKPSITLAVFQLPGSNALKTAQAVRAEMKRLQSTRFPTGVEYAIVYDTTIVVDESVHEVYKTLFEAFILVFIVVILFLQDWRATLMPMIDVPVSLIGTLAVMQWMGFSLNNLSMLGLVLAIGIVVDDAIVVVENIERWMAKGLPAREATIKAMGEITGPVIAITLVLSSVFLPTVFIAGIPGKFFQQFALTIAASTIISAINAMTMAPARAVTLIKPHVEGHDREALPRWGIALLIGYVSMRFLSGIVEPMFGVANAALSDASVSGEAVESKMNWIRFLILGALFLSGYFVGWLVGPVLNWGLQRFFGVFNKFFDFATYCYGKIVSGVLRISFVMLILYVVLIGLAVRGFQVVPAGFLPSQDKGYLVVSAKLPDGASLQRTEAVAESINEVLLSVDGVAHTLSIPGYSILTSTNASNSVGMFVILDSFEHRSKRQDLYATALVETIQKKLSGIQEAQIVVFGAPPIDGLASTAGMKMQVQDRAGVGPAALQGAMENLVAAGRFEPRMVGAYSSYFANEPQLYVDINREKAKSAGVALNDVFQTLQIYLGSAYANDITRFGRNWQVSVQADSQFRANPADIGRLQVRNQGGEMVPLATLIDVRDVSGPGIVYRFNMYTSADFVANPAPGSGSGETIGLMERIAKRELPSSMSFEWTELAYQQILVGKDLLTKLVFPLAVIFVFMVLAAQYESWSLPMAILLIVPMCLFAAVAGLWLTNSESNIFTQIGLIVLIALAAKNAILIVEFAKQLQSEGKDRREAVVEACKVRLRPILMTSFAFILGVAPLMIGRGAGFEMRRSLGLAVFSGMVGVTFFGLIFTPVFYVIIDSLGERFKSRAKAESHEQPVRSIKRKWWDRIKEKFRKK